MPSDEFSIIRHYFSTIGNTSSNRLLGIGDDAAVMAVPAAHQLVVCMDTLVSGVHFPEVTPAADIAWKSLAVNLSDLAAMAAEPDWFLLSLTIPDGDETWIGEFAAALHDCASAFRVDLVGGDTCRGPLSVSIQVAGLVPEDRYVKRHNCQPGDLIVVSGILGEAALGLDVSKGLVDLDAELAVHCLERLNRPSPRLELRDFLRHHATAAIDVSDGLVADLRHILESSDTGAVIDAAKLPVNNWSRANNRLDYALYGGDDYEICCTVAAYHQPEINRWNRDNPDCQLTVIGEVTDHGITLRNNSGHQDLSNAQGFRHFD